MSGNLLWTGLTMVVALPDFADIPVKLVGAILMVIGCVLMWLGR